jgi:ABC-type dipeptide/oligopeptide/nickel transport system permease component
MASASRGCCRATSRSRSGSLFVEVVAGLPGLGSAVVSAAGGPDSALVAGVLVAGSLLAAAVTFLVDVTCAAVDPRFRRF